MFAQMYSIFFELHHNYTVINRHLLSICLKLVEKISICQNIVHFQVEMLPVLTNTYTLLEFSVTGGQIPFRMLFCGGCQKKAWRSIAKKGKPL